MSDTEHRSVRDVAARLQAEGHIPAPLAHRPPLEFVLVSRECVLACEADTDRAGEWIETDALVEVRP